MRMLVVEDDLDLLEALAEGLRMNGYAVDTCDNGEDAYRLLYVENYDLVILDLNLPRMDGLEVLSKIRNDKPGLKVLILSARGSVEDKVNGLDLGANDYLSKPFDFAELEARIRNLLRQQHVETFTTVSCGHLIVDLTKNRTAFIDNEPLSLTKKEFALLEYLILHKNNIVSQEELIEHAWDLNADCFSGAIRVHISSLRKKLKEKLLYDPIETKVGQGYILSDQIGESHV